MTNSRSSTSTSRLWIVVATLVLWVGSASAERRRVVVLEFEGPKAEKFRDDVVKLLKKSNTVVSIDKWNSLAEELDAAKVTAKNVKKLAKKLKVDGVVTGIIEKRREEYIIRLKLRAGTTGEPTGISVQTKAEGPRLEGPAQRDIKEELVAAIEELDSNRGGDDEEEVEDTLKKKKDVAEETPKKSGFSRKKGDEEALEEKPAKKKKGDIDAEQAALATKKSGPDAVADEPKNRPKSSDTEEEGEGKKQASVDDEDGKEEARVEAEVEEAPADAEKLSPSRRAVDAVVGLSFTARKLKFTYASDLGKVPPGYKQTIPVAGALADITLYPLSFGKSNGIVSGIGLSVLYDQVIKINSQKRYADATGMQQIADLKTEESRWAAGAVLRYPLGTGAKAPVVGGSITYGRQKFSVEQVLPNDEKTDIPNVHYTMITPGAFVIVPVTSKLALNAEGAFHGITNTGAIQKPDQYGAATVTAYEANAGFEYMLLKNIFLRASFRYENLSFKFKGDPMSQTHTRDTDPEQDVTGAKDTYIGGTATLGYVY